jgi:diguanylate cyclase (GGDEF)-like protein
MGGNQLNYLLPDRIVQAREENAVRDVISSGSHKAMSAAITLAGLEQAINSGSPRLPQNLDDAFEQDRRTYLAAATKTIILRSVVGYNIFLPLDFLLLPKTAWLATLLHVCVITPYLIFAVFMLRRDPGPKLRDAVGMMIPILIISQVMIIYRLNSGVAATQYQYLAVLVMVYTNNNQLLNMRFAALTSAITGGIYLLAILTGPSPEVARITGVAMMGGAAYLSLDAKARLYQSARLTFLRQMHDRLQRDEAESEASRDALTGLSNRRHFEDRIAALQSNNDPSAGPVALIMIDIDHFKLFNDSYGHPAGDHCLKRIAGVLAATLRGEQDLAIRFGGEEFLLLLPDTNLETAIQIAERVRRAIEAMAIPHQASPTSPIVTATLGAAAAPPATPAESLIAQADTALYAAKRAGRNQVKPLCHPREPMPVTTWWAAG